MSRVVKQNVHRELRLSSVEDKNGGGPAVVIEAWVGHSASAGATVKKYETFLRGKQVAALIAALETCDRERAALERKGKL